AGARSLRAPEFACAMSFISQYYDSEIWYLEKIFFICVIARSTASAGDMPLTMTLPTAWPQTCFALTRAYAGFSICGHGAVGPSTSCFVATGICGSDLSVQYGSFSIFAGMTGSQRPWDALRYWSSTLG